MVYHILNGDALKEQLPTLSGEVIVFRECLVEGPVKAADEQNGKLLEEVMEPKSQQYVLAGGKLTSFSTTDYIAMVNAKKLGGKPRKITYRLAEFSGKNLAIVVLNAVSDQFDFLYQFSMTKRADGKWEIVAVTAEVSGV